MFTLVLVALAAVPVGDVKGPLVLDLGAVKATLRASVSLRVQDLSTYGPRGEGLGYIDWRWPGGANTDGLTLTFDRAVSFVSLEAGDWGSDDDGPLELHRLGLRPSPPRHDEGAVGRHARVAVPDAARGRKGHLPGALPLRGPVRRQHVHHPHPRRVVG